MELQDLLFMMAPIGLYITTKEWRNLVQTSRGNFFKIVGRIFVLNLPIVLLVIHFTRQGL